MQRPSFGKVILWLFLLLIVLIVGYFCVQTYRYYGALRRGEITGNPLAQKQLQSRVSRALEERPITQQDLARLDDPRAPRFGSSTSTLSVSLFLDYDCPYCKDTYPVWRELMHAYAGRVRFVAHEYPIEELHPQAFRASVAAQCAHNQGKYWGFHDKLYTHPEQRDDRSYLQFAREVGLNEEVFQSCLQEEKTAERVRADQAYGAQLGAAGTPTFFFQGVRVDGGLEREHFRALLEQFLQAVNTTGTRL